MSNITCGDNTSAFGGNFLTITLQNQTGADIKVSKAVFVCGTVRVEVVDPEFPLQINLNEEQTAQLNCKNVCYLAVWDELGRKLTCEGSLTVGTRPRKV